MLKKYNGGDMKTVATVAVVLMAIAAVVRSAAAAAAAALLVLAALLSPRFASAASSAWLRFGAFLGAFNTRLLLGLIYFLVLTPVAMLSRLFRPSRMRLKAGRGSGSYFREDRHSYSPEDFEHPW